MPNLLTATLLRGFSKVLHAGIGCIQRTDGQTDREYVTIHERIHVLICSYESGDGTNHHHHHDRTVVDVSNAGLFFSAVAAAVGFFLSARSCLHRLAETPLKAITRVIYYTMTIYNQYHTLLYAHLLLEGPYWRPYC